MGVIDLEEAWRIAQERRLDLIQVTEKVDPPVCRLGDHGKYLYWLEKKQKAKKVGGQTKGVRLSFGISEHDLMIRVKQAEKFLKAGNKVAVEMILRGRQKALSGFAREKTRHFLDLLNQSCLVKVEMEPKKGPRGFTMIIAKQ